MKTISRARAAAAAALASIACGAVWSAEPYALYEDFSSPTLDQTRWTGGERVREVKGGAMYFFQRDWGATTADTGGQFVSWGDDISVPGKVTQLRARLRVNAIELTPCAANPVLAYSRARILGTFFNTGNPLSGNYVGDVLAQVRVGRFSNSADAPGVLRVQGLIVMCTNADCSASTLLGSVVELGTTSVGSNVEVQMEWNKAQKKFVFANLTGAVTGEVPYTLSDGAGPARPLHAIGTRIDAPNCASGPRGMGSIDANFDFVSVNRNARP
jgi:hypothetical protein